MQSSRSGGALSAFSDDRPSWLTAEEWAECQARASRLMAVLRHGEAIGRAAEARKTWRVIQGEGRKENYIKPQLTLV